MGKLTAVLCVLLLTAAMTLLAADVSGKWVAQAPGRDGQTREVTFNLKADGDKLTGTVSSPMGDREISDGKVNGDEVSFSVAMEFNGQAVKVLYKGKVAGDEMKLTRQREGSERTQEFTAKRAS